MKIKVVYNAKNYIPTRAYLNIYEFSYDKTAMWVMMGFPKLGVYKFKIQLT